MTRNDARSEKPPTDGRAQVLLVDDHPIVCQGLAALIDEQPDLRVCGQAADEPGAWEQIRTHRPDIVVADLSLRKGSGIDLIKRVRGEYPQMAVLVLSMHDESYYVERALRAGAWGYLTKGEASDKVLVAIRALLEGKIYLSDRLSPTLLKKLLSGATDDGGDSPVGRLSDRELEVFLFIGSGMGGQEIASKLHLSIKTIETYQAHIKEKLSLKDTRKLVQFAIRWALTHDAGQK